MIKNTFKVIFIAMILLISSGLFIYSTQNVSATPYTGPEPTPTNLTLYLHNTTKPIYVGTTPTLEVLNTINDTNVSYAKTGEVDQALHYITVSFIVAPQLKGPLEINGSPMLGLYVNQTGSTTSGGSITYSLYTLTPSGGTTLIGTSAPYSLSNVKSGTIPNYNAIPFGSNKSTTIPANDSLEMTISLSGSSSNYYGIWWGIVSNTYYYSQLNLPASTYLNIQNITQYNYAGKPTNTFLGTYANKTVKIVTNITDPLGTYDFVNWSVNYEIKNSTNVFFNGKMKAVGKLSYDNYNQFYYIEFNYSGLLPGAYEILINSTDNTYHNLYGQSTGTGYYGRNAYGLSYFWIGAKPINVETKILDSKGKALVNSTVKVYAGNSFIIGNTTNSTGNAGFYLVGNTTYNVFVYYEGINVGSFVMNVTQNNTNFTFITEVYYPNFVIMDQKNIPLGSALVYIVSPNGYHYPLMITNNSGTISLYQVPIGNYSFTIIWHDSIVFNGNVSVNSNVNIPVITSVYYQTFIVKEPNGIPLNLADILVLNKTTGIIIAFNYTDINGSSTVRVPSGDFEVQVLWKTSMVADISISIPSASNPYIITASLYTVYFKAVDSMNNAVSNAEISIYQSNTLITSLVTNSTGQSSYLLAGGSYMVKTFYFNIPVSTAYINISSSIAITLHLKMYMVNLTGVDVKGIPVGNSHLQLRYSNSSNFVINTTTNNIGQTHVILPLGTYDVSSVWKGIPVYNGTFNVSSNENITLHLNIFYLTITATKNDGSMLNNVFIEVYMNDQLFSSGITPSNGTVVIRLPVGKYQIIATYSGTYDFTPEYQQITTNVTLTSSMNEKISFSSINPSFTSTVEFDFIAVSIVFLAIIVILLMLAISEKLRKKIFKGKPKEEVKKN
ncbi:MAG: hypothetical protein ACP5UL_01525 [Thermoplasmata archaeon]